MTANGNRGCGGSSASQAFIIDLLYTTVSLACVWFAARGSAPRAGGATGAAAVAGGSVARGVAAVECHRGGGGAVSGGCGRVGRARLGRRGRARGDQAGAARTGHPAVPAPGTVHAGLAAAAAARRAVVRPAGYWQDDAGQGAGGRIGRVLPQRGALDVAEQVGGRDAAVDAGDILAGAQAATVHRVYRRDRRAVSHTRRRRPRGVPRLQGGDDAVVGRADDGSVRADIVVGRHQSAVGRRHGHSATHAAQFPGGLAGPATAAGDSAGHLATGCTSSGGRFGRLRGHDRGILRQRFEGAVSSGGAVDVARCLAGGAGARSGTAEHAVPAPHHPGRFPTGDA
eukprot:ctg_670.g287